MIDSRTAVWIVTPPKPEMPWRDETAAEAQARREQHEIIYRRYIARVFAERDGAR